MKEGVVALSAVLQEWIANDGAIPEVDWGKMRSLEFQETLQRRNTVWGQNSDRGCLQCPEFNSHVSMGARTI